MHVQVSLAAEDIRNEKVKVLKCMKAMSMDDVVLGQYRARTLKGHHYPGYLDDKTVPPDRCCSQSSQLLLPDVCRQTPAQHVSIMLKGHHYPGYLDNKTVLPDWCCLSQCST